MTNQKQNFYLAPLRGVTDRVFRNIYEKHFGQFDYMLAPFIPTIRGNRVKGHHIRDVLPCGGNDPKRLIPQIIGHDTEGFLLLSREFARLGFASVNWNLGCPAPLITRKKRGSGLLPHKDIIRRFLDETAPKLPIPLSIKARLGLDGKDDLEKLMPIFNDYPLKEIMIHPRTGAQMYDGRVDIDKFETCLRESKHKIVYNGDIRTADDYNRLTARFPNVNRWMIGRGIVMNPNLLNVLKREAGQQTQPLMPEQSAQSIKNFFADLLNACENHPNQTAVLGRMKEIWRYFDTGGLREKVLRCESIAEYRDILFTRR